MGKIGIPELIVFILVAAFILYLTRERKERD
jgi:hypothetical protein